MEGPNGLEDIKEVKGSQLVQPVKTIRGLISKK